MMIVQSIWLHQPTYKLCMKVVFPSNKLFVEKVLLTIRGKKLATYVQPTLATCIFDLWMSTKAHEMFIVIVNFLWSNWEPKHVMFVCLFVAWFPNCKCSLTYFLWHIFFFVYVKDEGYNLQTYAIALNFMNLSHKYLPCCSHFTNLIMGMHYPRFPSMLV